MKVALFTLMTEKQSNATLSLFDDLPANNDKLDRQAAATRMRELEKELERWNYEYYVLDTPSVPDSEYDKAFRELSELEKQFPTLKSPVSPTQRVGGEARSDLAKVRHAVPMLSIHTETDFEAQGAQAFDERVRKGLGLVETDDDVAYDVELKFDGFSYEPSL